MKKYIVLKYTYAVLITTALTSIVLLIFISSKSDKASAQTVIINKNTSIKSSNNIIDINLNLESTQNGKKIKLTKFVSTKKKLAFDYQFVIDDENLRSLLKKYAMAHENRQFIDIGLFDSANQIYLYCGVATESTFIVERNTFYGTVISTFDEAKIPENSELSLHIYRLYWQDLEELETKKSRVIQDKSINSFSIDNALEYEGDWQFSVKSTPVLQTKKPAVSSVVNLNNIRAESDALQTTISFDATLNDELIPSVTIYKDNVIQNNCISRETINTKTGKVEVTFNLSALEHNNSMYKIELVTVSPDNQQRHIIGSFQLQNT